jgi:hypothetical protein
MPLNAMDSGKNMLRCLFGLEARGTQVRFRLVDAFHVSTRNRNRNIIDALLSGIGVGVDLSILLHFSLFCGLMA